MLGGGVKEPDGRGRAARGISEPHAEESDLPILVSGLTEAREERGFCALCRFIDALARLSDSASVEEIATIYEDVEYSYARRRAARALIAIDEQADVGRYARPALWDCEREIQDLAISVLGDQVDEIARDRIAAIEGRRTK